MLFFASLATQRDIHFFVVHRVAEVLSMMGSTRVNFTMEITPPYLPEFQTAQWIHNKKTCKDAMQHLQIVRVGAMSTPHGVFDTCM